MVEPIFVHAMLVPHDIHVPCSFWLESVAGAIYVEGAHYLEKES